MEVERMNRVEVGRRREIKWLPGLLVSCFLVLNVYGQGDPAYEKVAYGRAEKIVEQLNIADPDKAQRVTRLVAGQYIQLNAIHTKRDEAIEQDPANADRIRREADKAVAERHDIYLSGLAAELNEAQVESVKNGMTYHVVPLTFENYQLMIPYLSAEQEDTILSLLNEAREFAMDGGSSKEKHGWFGKYKGKIANYLSAEGYDLKQLGNDWADRRRTDDTTLAIRESNRIVAVLALDNKAVNERVRNLVAHQYQEIRDIDDERDSLLAVVAASALEEREKEQQATRVWTESKAKLDAQRDKYFTKLATWLNGDQIERIKDEMTGHGLMKAYNHFLELLPNLKNQEKETVYKYLAEARENALNVLTRRGQNQWFAKYRGRANNYLSKRGYDLREATAALKQRKRPD